jgi:hypothetical protein
MNFEDDYDDLFNLRVHTYLVHFDGKNFTKQISQISFFKLYLKANIFADDCFFQLLVFRSGSDCSPTF